MNNPSGNIRTSPNPHKPARTHRLEAQRRHSVHLWPQKPQPLLVQWWVVSRSFHLQWSILQIGKQKHIRNFLALALPQTYTYRDREKRVVVVVVGGGGLQAKFIHKRPTLFWYSCSWLPEVTTTSFLSFNYVSMCPFTHFNAFCSNR